MQRSTRRFVGASYFAIQAALTLSWWVWMFNAPEGRDIFFKPGTAELLLHKFILPDTLVLAGSGVAAAVLTLLHSRWAMAAAWLTVGAATYACVGALAINWPLGGRPAADAMMVLTMAGSAIAALLVSGADE